jgi:ATP-binding cassette subfamily B protein
MMNFGHFGGGFGMRGHGHRHNIDDDQTPSHYDAQIIKRMMKYFVPFRNLILVSILSMFFYTGVTIATPWLIGTIIDTHITPSSSEGLLIALLVLISLAFIHFGSNYTYIRIIARISTKVLLSMRINLFGHMHKLSQSFFDQNEVGRLISRLIHDIEQLREFLSIFIITLGDLISLFGILTIMFLMNVQLALLAVITVPIWIIIITLWQKHARKAFYRTRVTTANVNAQLNENISGIRLIQSLNREKPNARMFDNTNYSNLESHLTATRFQAALMPGVEILNSISISLIIFVGGLTILNGNTNFTIGELIAFLLYTYRLYEPIRQLSMQYGSLQRAMVAAQRVFKILDTNPEIEFRKTNSNFIYSKGNIEFNNVNFHYKNTDLVLTDINLQIKHGETIAIVGPTGGGKTSLVSVLTRLYDITSGEILIDGKNIKTLSQQDIAKNITMIPQDPFLFSNTILENIRYGKTDASKEEIVKVCELIGIHNFILKLPSGYNHFVQEGGVSLSVGERQLICLARALITNSNIVILDEATSNIDSSTEESISRTLNQMFSKKTVIIIAHRLSTAKNANKINVIENSKITETGTHDTLIKQKGTYYNLWENKAKPIKGN